MSNASTASGDNQDSVNQDSQNNDKVAYATYLKTLNEAKKLKDRVKELETSVNADKENKLKETNQFKELYESTKAQLAEKDQKLSGLEKAVNDGAKFQEFQKHLGGTLKNKDYATFIDFDKILINPESGAVDEASVKTVVQSFVKEHSHLVEFGQGRLPNQAPKGDGNLSGKRPEEMTSAELEAQLKKMGPLAQ